MQELIQSCTEQLNKIGVSNVNTDLLENIIGAFGPSAFNEDAQLVAFSDEEEVERFLKSNVNAKLGLSIDMSDVAWLKEQFSGVNQRLRVVAYYLLKTR
jgi:hypothetical protein